MTSREPVTILSANDRARVVCLTGFLDAEAWLKLEQEFGQHLLEAARHDQRLILDLAAVQVVSAAARRTLQQATAHLADAPVLVVAAPPAVREVLERCPLTGIRLHDTLTGALRSLPPLPADTHTSTDVPADREMRRAAEMERDDLQGEVFGIRAKARSSALIGVAQGILIARYGLPGPAAAFALLRQASQHLNVPCASLPPPRSPRPRRRPKRRGFPDGAATRPIRTPSSCATGRSTPRTVVRS
ncbi:ANTAR domain-containing protein [Streptomyces sp. NPDC058534]|uniref:ANTAR domain-containing protein n=1 Tax=Streptomyces sp. NPDC058534 TaxID=3346541 RepID=UPI003660130A